MDAMMHGLLKAKAQHPGNLGASVSRHGICRITRALARFSHQLSSNASAVVCTVAVSFCHHLFELLPLDPKEWEPTIEKMAIDKLSGQDCS
jgi:hypothetical protein